MEFRIFCFSWNSGGLRLCETTSQQAADNARNGLRRFISFKEPCIAPNFIEDIKTMILQRNPSLIVMTTEEEAYEETYFHARVLPESLSQINYSLLKRDQNYGVGETNSGNKPKDIISGDIGDSALRISVYARNDIIPDLEVTEMRLNDDIGFKGQVVSNMAIFGRLSGAICSYVWHPIYGKFAFIAAHFVGGRKPDNLANSVYRSMVKSFNNLSLISLLYDFELNLVNEYKPNYVILMGDLNYNIIVPNRTIPSVISDLTKDLSLNKLRELQNYDELKTARNQPIWHGFKEGINDQGALFMPTWNLKRGRDNSCSIKQQMGKVQEQNKIQISSECFNDQDQGWGWHDRILYKDNLTSNGRISCLEYDRIDIKNMHQSDHAGVIALFSV